MIKISNLKMAYRNNTILDDINLEFESGKLYGIIGNNGSGKTTLLQCINEELCYERGEILIKGRKKRDMSYKEQAITMSFMRQNTMAKFPYKVYDFILMGRYAYHRGFPKEHDYQVANKYILDNNLESLKDKAINQLSGGEFQRVNFTKTLCQSSEIILIDEGGSNADLHFKIKLMNQLKKEVLLGKTVICIMHDLGLARKYCDELIILHNKKVVKKGKSTKVLDEEMLEEVFKVNGHFINDSLVLY